MTALAIAKEFARHIESAEGGNLGEYGPKVRNRRETEEHGWMPGALATVAYEGGIDLVDLSMALINLGREDGFYVEPYSSWLVGVYAA